MLLVNGFDTKFNSNEEGFDFSRNNYGMENKFFVYLILNKNNTSYVGYTSNLKKRLKKHNSSKGAKFTRGKKWILIYYKQFKSKSEAMKEEYKLKKNYILRKKIKKPFLQNE